MGCPMCSTASSPRSYPGGASVAGASPSSVAGLAQRRRSAAARSGGVAIERSSWRSWLMRKPLLRRARPPFRAPATAHRARQVCQSHRLVASGAGGGAGGSSAAAAAAASRRVHRGVGIARLHRHSQGHLVLEGTRDVERSSCQRRRRAATPSHRGATAPAPAPGSHLPPRSHLPRARAYSHSHAHARRRAVIASARSEARGSEASVDRAADADAAGSLGVRAHGGHAGVQMTTGLLVRSRPSYVERCLETDGLRRSPTRDAHAAG